MASARSGAVGVSAVQSPGRSPRVRCVADLQRRCGCEVPPAPELALWLIASRLSGRYQIAAGGVARRAALGSWYGRSRCVGQRFEYLPAVAADVIPAVVMVNRHTVTHCSQ